MLYPAGNRRTARSSRRLAASGTTSKEGRTTFMDKRLSLIAALALLMVGAMLVAGCGGDDDDDGGGAATATVDNGGAGGTRTAEAGDPTERPATTGGVNPTGEPDDGGTAADACALVSRAEAEAALGSPLQEPYVTYTGVANVGLSNAQATVSTCAYIADAGIPSANINYWSSPGNAAAIRTMVEGACQGKEMIDGLGDVACWYDSQHAEIQLATGATFLDIFATVEGDAGGALLDLSEASVDKLS
jgi:hypothetical protein